MKHIKLLSSIALVTCSLSVSAAIKNTVNTPADPGIINESSILYWMEKRGELSGNATEAQKKQAIKNYLGKKTFETKPLPEAFAKQYNIDQKNGFVQTQTTHLRKGKYTVKAQAVVTETKVLAVLIDFSDHTADQTAYPVSHYTDLLYDNSTGASGEVKSAYQYYQRESGATLNFTGAVQGWVRADNEAAYYGGNDENDDDKAAKELVIEAVTKAVAELNVDLSEYDKTDFFDIDGDGNIYEPDGIVDHVMVFHSSIGEEAGGGTLGADAIWSHRFFVGNDPVSIPGSDIKLFGYTITPIDARVGVVVHEFGHDLGVPDEYDTANGTYGSPVADWSLMSSGSWVDGGSHPSGFSPYAKDYYQTRFGGNWVNQQVVELDQLMSENIDLVAATNHNANTINQVKINLPPVKVAFGAPYSGDYQFYSGDGDNLTSELSFDVTLPAGASTLAMKARWDIEKNWDYVVVSINDTVIAGNHTNINNPVVERSDIHNYLSDKSLNITGAEGDLGWVDLSYDLSAYENQAVTVKISYITDQNTYEYGFVADDIKVMNGGNDLFVQGAESAENVTLTGKFARVMDTRDGANHHYFVQLRDHNSTDEYLANANYDAGLLVWYRNEGVSNNQVNAHPGKVFVGVVDADQNAITSGTSLRGTSTQIRDAAFSRFDQTTTSGDTNLTAISKFDDKLNYSTPYQPESGIVLPVFGLSIDLTDQATDSTTASITVAKTDAAQVMINHDGLSVSLSIDDADVSVDSTFTWEMGDNTTLMGASINHTYAQADEFVVSVTYQTSTGNKTLSKKVKVGNIIETDINSTSNDKVATFVPAVTGGEGNLFYRWNFGDGSEISTSKNPSHTYESYGTYDVVLTVVDDTMQQFTFTKSVTIDNALNSTFSVAKSYLKATFTSTVSGGDESYTYEWNFGDESAVSVEANPIHTYSKAGSYTIALKVTDGTGTSINSEQTIVVAAQVVVTPPPVTPPKKSSSGGGGSFGLWLLALAGVSLVRKKNVK